MAKVELKFAFHPLKWHPYINDEDAAGFARVTGEPYGDMIREWIATDKLPLVPPNRHTKPKCFPGWQGAVSLCKGRAVAELIKADAAKLDAPRMVVWTGTNVLPQWFLGRDSLLTAKIAICVYGGQEYESFAKKYQRWTRSSRTVLIAHHGVLLQPEHAALCDTGMAPEIIFPEPYWDPALAEAAIRTALRNPMFDAAHIRFLGIKGTLDEEVARYCCKKTAERFS